MPCVNQRAKRLFEHLRRRLRCRGQNLFAAEHLEEIAPAQVKVIAIAPVAEHDEERNDRYPEGCRALRLNIRGAVGDDGYRQ